MWKNLNSGAGQLLISFYNLCLLSVFLTIKDNADFFLMHVADTEVVACDYEIIIFKSQTLFCVWYK